MLQQLEPRTEAPAAGDSGLAFRRIHQLQKLTRQRRERNAAFPHHVGELDRRRQLHVMS